MRLIDFANTTRRAQRAEHCIVTNALHNTYTTPLLPIQLQNSFSLDKCADVQTRDALERLIDTLHELRDAINTQTQMW